MQSFRLDLLDKIEDRDSVSNRTIQRISIVCEDNVSLPVHGPKYVRKLERSQSVNARMGVTYLVVCLHPTFFSTAT